MRSTVNFSLCRTAEGESLEELEDISDLPACDPRFFFPFFPVEQLRSDGITAPSLVPSSTPETFLCCMVG